MSGTSLDGVDAVVADFSDGRLRLLGDAHLPFDEDIRDRLLRLCTPGDNEIDRAGELGIQLAAVYAAAALAALRSADVAASQVRAIGCHGQTVRHRPDGGYSVQIGNPAQLAEQTGIAVVADFRSRDLAAGGQGAPLVPAFHAYAFGKPESDRAVCNIGGIANITILRGQTVIGGFDTGPGNTLLDAWIRRHLGRAFDAEGKWGASGRVDEALLTRLGSDPYFRQPPPKSTGRERFDLDWVDAAVSKGTQAVDVQATLTVLTARTIADAVLAHGKETMALIVCGGGAENPALMSALKTRLPRIAVETSDRYGIAPHLVEASAFAWLARETLEGRPGNLPRATGARGPRILGAIYPR